MTYLTSFETYKRGGPILFYTGNEGSIDHFADNSGLLFELAKNMSGAVIFAEHRYYGSSLPFGENSYKNRSYFGYLTVEQALADYAKLIKDFKCANEEFLGAPVIAFGGSYGGMLAAWFRQHYPNIIAGSLASSAPVWLFPGMSDCESFAKVTTETFSRAGGSQCVDKIRRIWDLIKEIANTSSGVDVLSMGFKTCEPIRNIKDLFDFAQDYLVTLSMANYPYSTSFLGMLPAWPVTEFCKEMATHTTHYTGLPLEVSQFAHALFAMNNYNSSQQCLSIDSLSPNLDLNGWTLQTCMETTTPVCANGIDDMFMPQKWDPIAFSEYCQNLFGIRPRMDWANLQLWGKDLRSLTNVIFSNGDLDPWSAFGVLDNRNAPHVHIVKIAKAAHHYDLRGSHPNDTSAVQEVRARETNIISRWIDDWKSDAISRSADICL